MLILVALLAGCGDRFPGFGESMMALKAVASVDTAETEYFKAHRRFGSLAELDSEPRMSIRTDLQSARGAGYEFRLTLTGEGYEIIARPMRGDGPYLHSYFSDQTGVIRQHRGGGLPAANDPSIDDRLQKPEPTEPVTTLPCFLLFQLHFSPEFRVYNPVA